MGCEVAREIALPDTTPLSLLPDVRVDRVGNGLVLIGADVDAGSVRWLVDRRKRRRGHRAIAAAAGRHDGGALPRSAASRRPAIASSSVCSPRSRPVRPPSSTSSPRRPTERRRRCPDPRCSRSPAASTRWWRWRRRSPRWSPASAGWTRTPACRLYALVDGQGGIVDQAMNPVDTDPAARYECLGFTAGEGEATLSYLRYPTLALALPTWVIADYGPGYRRVHAQADRRAAGRRHDRLRVDHPDDPPARLRAWSGRTTRAAGCPVLLRATSDLPT